MGYAGIEMKCSRSDLHRHWAGFKSAASSLGYAAKNGPRSAHCMAAGAAKWSRRQDLHPHFSVSETDASALGYAGKNE